MQKFERSNPHPLKDTKPRIRLLPKPRKHEGALAIPRTCGEAQRNESGFPYSIEATKPLLRKAAETVASRHRG
ncbi:MAG: hypothetical protein JSR41_19600 [Proteobacteria bacterium]|nr:hypothetical protein [Pseudomonadota bacterium]